MALYSCPQVSQGHRIHLKEVGFSDIFRGVLSGSGVGGVHTVVGVDLGIRMCFVMVKGA